MSRTAPTRNQLVAAIIAQGRANSTGTVLLHAAIAERLGLNPSDHKCADLMMSQSEACTPGRLAELTGLSTGAITGVIDRLEGAGFLVREHDPEDRRRVLLRLTHTRAPELQALFAPLARGVESLCERYTIAELAVVLRYMREVQRLTDEIADNLRSGSVGARLSPAAPPQLAAAAMAGGSGRRELVVGDPQSKSRKRARHAKSVSKSKTRATERGNGATARSAEHRSKRNESARDSKIS
jgi:DNA-binding MarR family transcriptional regulator